MSNLQPKPNPRWAPYSPWMTRGLRFPQFLSWIRYSRRLLVIGFDAATCDLINLWAQVGRLPHLGYID